MKPFNIRNADFDVVARCDGLASVLARSGKNLDRIDVWLGAKDACQIGLSWIDGRSAIFDFPDAVKALKMFSDGIALGRPAPIIHAARSST